MSFIQNLFTSRDNNANAATYVGQQDRLWWNPDTNAFYYSDGNTAGGIPVGTSSGNGLPHGPTNSVQLNSGNGTFLGSSNLTFANNVLLVNGNVVANYFAGDGSQLTNLPGISLGNLYVLDQTIYGNNINGNINLTPEGSGIVNVPGLGLQPTGTLLQSYVAVGNANPGVSLTTPANADITLGPGLNANIITAGNIMPPGNNIASLGQPEYRYTGIWLGTGNINIIDQGTGNNQQIYAENGNIIFANSTGANFGNFRFYDDTMALANTAANMIVGGSANAIGWVQFNRAIAVSTTTGTNAFEVDKAGRTQIFATSVAANTPGALNIVASDNGAYQNVTNSGGMIHLTGAADNASRITVDTYGTVGGTGAPGVLVFRSARGNASTPTATQANDTLARVSAVGWGNTPGFGAGATLAATAVEFVALETFTPTAQGSKITFNTADIGANSRSVSATIQANGVSFLNNTTANSGITFRDGTFQNTAYSPATVVSSATAATGISISPSSTGNITITNTGVITTAGTTNQVYVNGNTAPGAGVITLSLPQDINTNSNVSFYSLTVTDLNITGNVSNVIPSVVDGPIIYVANTATALPNINNSGLVTGNVGNSAYAGILYNTTSNTWVMDIGNSVGITADTIYTTNIVANGVIQAGNVYATPIAAPTLAFRGDLDLDDVIGVGIQNHNQGANAATAFIAAPNNGVGPFGNYFIAGINSNVYANAQFLVTGPNDGYVRVNGGNLIIGTETPTKTIKFFTGGTNSATAYNRATITDVGLSVAGNVTANNFVGNTVSATVVSGTTVTGTTISATGVVSGVSLVGTTVSATGTITGGNLRTGGNISAAGNITGGNLITATTVIDGGISTTGNITGAVLAVSGIVASGSISAAGNITGANLISATQIITPLLSVTGNITGGNLITTGLISTTGNATFGNVQTIGRISVTGNVDAGNLRTAGQAVATTISATGNITGNYFIGNGSQLTGIVSSTNAFQTVVANGTSLSYTANASTLTLTPGNNIVIVGNATTATANIAVNNNPTFATVSVTGNITISGNINTANTTYLSNVGNILFSNVSPLSTAVPGVMEYDGRILYFTGQDQERGIVPNQQWYVLNADRGLTYASTTPQSLFGVGAHVSNSTRYWFRLKATISRAAGTNNTALTLGWRGSAVLSKLNYTAQGSIGAVSTPTSSTTYETTLVAGFTVQTAVTGTSNPPDSTTLVIQGMIDVGATGAGYVEPFISWTGAAAPGSVTVSSLSYFQLFPLGATGANTNVGNWA